MTTDAPTNPAIQRARIEALADDLRRGKEYTEDLGSISRDIQFGEAKGEGDMQLMSTADFIPLWNRATGEQSFALTDQLKVRLSQRFDSRHPTMPGQLVYTDVPMESVIKGELRCPLTADHPAREFYDGLGFRTTICTKANIPYEEAVEDHLRVKHPKVWKAKEKREERQRQDLQMELTRQQTAAMERMASDRPSPRAQKVKEEVNA